MVCDRQLDEIARQKELDQHQEEMAYLAYLQQQEEERERQQRNFEEERFKLSQMQETKVQ